MFKLMYIIISFMIKTKGSLSKQLIYIHLKYNLDK